jgi:hemolysin activation/secretion protein
MQMNQAKNLLKHVVLTSGCLALPVWAAGAPDAGAIQNQIEQTLRQPAPAQQAPVKSISVDTSSPADLRVVVSGFDFVGNTLIASDVLAKATSEYLDRPLTLTQLRQAGQLVVQLYKEAGWMVNAFLPAQEIDKGRVRIQVVEARLGKVTYSGATSRVKTEQLDALVRAQLQAGEPIRQDRLERALLLLNDMPGLSSSASFSQGEQAGQTDLVIDLADKPQLVGQAGLDNMGTSLTGLGRMTANLSVNSPWQRGDLLSLSALKTEGSHYGRVAYALPLGHDGLRVGAHASDMAYNAMSGTQRFKGNASTLGLDGTYPLLRSQQKNVTVNALLDRKSFDNTNSLDSARDSDYGIRVGQIGVIANVLDTWAGGGANNAALMLTSGRVTPTPQATDPSTVGQFTKWQLSLSRVQTVTASLSATFATQVQRANKSLDGSEKLYLGGAYGVRAYPGSEGSASEGETFMLELNQKLNAAVTVGAFYDYGHGRNPSAASFTMKGYGASVAWLPTAGLQLKAIAARRLGDAPDVTPTFSANRLWLSAQYSF